MCTFNSLNQWAYCVHCHSVRHGICSPGDTVAGEKESQTSNGALICQVRHHMVFL